MTYKEIAQSIQKAFPELKVKVELPPHLMSESLLLEQNLMLILKNYIIPYFQ